MAVLWDLRGMGVMPGGGCGWVGSWQKNVDNSEIVKIRLVNCAGFF